MTLQEQYKKETGLDASYTEPLYDGDDKYYTYTDEYVEWIQNKITNNISVTEEQVIANLSNDESNEIFQQLSKDALDLLNDKNPQDNPGRNYTLSDREKTILEVAKPYLQLERTKTLRLEVYNDIGYYNMWAVKDMEKRRFN